jgi:predicted RNA binding protein YcfA (HicA-like mRNA interferase family)
MRGAALRRIIEKHCGKAVRQKGSHRRYRCGRKSFTFVYHDGAEVSGSKVRRVLIGDVGLSPDEAWKEVS